MTAAKVLQARPFLYLNEFFPFSIRHCDSKANLLTSTLQNYQQCHCPSHQPQNSRPLSNKLIGLIPGSLQQYNLVLRLHKTKNGITEYDISIRNETIAAAATPVEGKAYENQV
ncbi:hypothetical protein WN943_006413 [Citrus x changshan-huyou]